MKSKEARAAVRAVKKGEVQVALQNIISALIEKFDENDWKGAKVSDLISLLVLYRGTQIEDHNGDNPIDKWIVSVSKKQAGQQ